MEHPLNIALVAHDQCKHDLLAWAIHNRDILVQHRLVATGTTGGLVAKALHTPVERVASDVKALLRIAVLNDIPTACNRSTADHLIHLTCLDQGLTDWADGDASRTAWSSLGRGGQLRQEGADAGFDVVTSAERR